MQEVSSAHGIHRSGTHGASETTRNGVDQRGHGPPHRRAEATAALFMVSILVLLRPVHI